MFRRSFRIVLGISLLSFAALASRAQEDKPDPAVVATKARIKKAEEDYRLFVKKPATVLEFWAAMRYEVQLGKFDVAGLHLELLLKEYNKKPEDGDKELVKIAEAEGLFPILNLRNIKKWSDFPPFQKEAVENTEKLVDRVTEALEKHLSDPERIQKFIKRLDAPTPEERAFARMQLMKSKSRAVPYLVEALRVNFGKALFSRIRDLMLEMDSEIVPAYLEVFRAANPNEAKELEPRLTLLDITLKRGDQRIVPYLWHLSESPQYPEKMREAAKKALALFTKTDPLHLLPAKIALTQLAEDYYHHRVNFPAKAVRIWRWDGVQVSTKPIELTPAQAEEFFGTRYARQALELDSKYLPAQVVLLSLTLERTLEPDLDQLLLKPLPPNLKNLLVTTNPELIGTVLERAMDDRKPAVIVATVQALGERGDPRVAKLSPGGNPMGLWRALFYPDRRVQFAAAQATVRIPDVPPVAKARVVDIYRRALAADPAPKALAAYIPPAKAAEVRKALKDAGFEPVLVPTIKDAFDKLKESSDYDFILLHRGLPELERPFVLSQLRGDYDQAGLPVFMVAGKDNQEALEKLAKKYRGVQAILEPALSLPDEFKARIETQIKAAQGAKLSADERKEFTRVALDALWRMSRGEYAGYDVRPAQVAILAAVRWPDTGLLALEILGRLPGNEIQQRLAGLVLDAKADKQRVAAAKELNRHVQKYGVLLAKKYAGALKTTYDTTPDPALKGELAIVVGLMSTPNAGQAGAQLFEFRPDAPAPPPMEKEKKDKDGK